MRYFTGKPCKHGHTDERSTGSGQCQECNRLMAAKHYRENKEVVKSARRAAYANNPHPARAQAKSWRDANPERSREVVAAWQNANRGRTRELALGWFRANPERAYELRARRRAAISQAVPLWFSELDELVWREAKTLARQRTIATGIDWHADHMIPLRSKAICGLHVWSNCQVIPAFLNLSKKAKPILIDHGEWICYL